MATADLKGPGEPRNSQVLFESGDLPRAHSVLMVVVVGESHPGFRGRVVVDRFDVAGAYESGRAVVVISNQWNYRGLQGGNYGRDRVTVGLGYNNEVRMRLAGHEPVPARSIYL